MITGQLLKDKTLRHFSELAPEIIIYTDDNKHFRFSSEHGEYGYCSSVAEACAWFRGFLSACAHYNVNPDGYKFGVPLH